MIYELLKGTYLIGSLQVPKLVDRLVSVYNDLSGVTDEKEARKIVLERILNKYPWAIQLATKLEESKTGNKEVDQELDSIIQKLKELDPSDEQGYKDLIRDNILSNIKLSGVGYFSKRIKNCLSRFK